MTNQSTIDKLIEMRLTSMSDAFITQMDDPKKQNNMISWNCFTDGEKNPPRFSARITIPVAGMTSSAAMTAPWQKLFLTASNTMPTRSTSFRLILTTTVP